MAPQQRLLLALALLSAARSGSPWPEAPRARARALLAQLTLDEKVSLLSGMNAGYGTPAAVSPYVGWTAGVPRLGIPALNWEDGPQGVADGLTGVTMWPSVGTVAQSWDVGLFQRWGAAMGAEQRGKGSSVMLGPAVTVSRVPWSGRVFEYLSECPHLNAALAAPYIAGVQSRNISACAKHWAFNHQELFRGDARGSPGMSSNVPQRAARELYGPPYAAAVDAGVGAVMCAFVRVNNTQACESPALLRDWLLGDLGFAGLVVSDWTATHSTVASALAGLTVEQEWLLNATYFGASLARAVRAGDVPQAALDAMALRVLTAIAATTDLLDAPRDPAAANASSPVTSPAHAALARELATAGTVLLRNAPLCLNPGFCAPLLPLDASTLCRVAIIGDPGDTVAGFGSGGVAAPYVVTPAAGLAAALGPRTTLIVVSGANASAAAAAAADADVALVLVGERTGEGMDRAGLLALPAGQDALVAAVAAAQPRTVVVARCSGPCLMPWRDSVLAIVSAYYGGQEAGSALADVLLGAANPAGRLALTWPSSNNDTWLSGGGGGGGPVDPQQYPGTDRGRGYPEVDYKEGLAVGYRWADLHGKEPLWPFGHGLRKVGGVPLLFLPPLFPSSPSPLPHTPPLLLSQLHYLQLHGPGRHWRSVCEHQRQPVLYADQLWRRGGRRGVAGVRGGRAAGGPAVGAAGLWPQRRAGRGRGGARDAGAHWQPAAAVEPGARRL